jgi:catechol 2,3-dioxygenase-like lactoylglutathione lyase family enzyme
MAAKLRHIAFSVPDPEKSAEFYINAFGMERVGETHNPIADGVYLSDGTVNLALLRFRDDKPMGPGKDKDWFGLHHIGFWVDDTKTMQKHVEGLGAEYFLGETPLEDGEEGGYFEVKYFDNDGNMFDLTHSGWAGAALCKGHTQGAIGMPMNRPW